MALITLASAKSSGVTTSALALSLASPRPTLLAECDPSGGTIRAGFLTAGVNPHIGLHQLASAERQGPERLAEAFAEQVQVLDEQGHRRLLPGLTDPLQAASMSASWPAVGRMLRLMDTQAGYDVVVDAGRLAVDAGQLHPVLSPAALLHQADVVLLVVRGWLDSLAAAAPVVPLLRAELAARGSGADALGVLLIEDGPERAHRVSQALGLPVLAALPWDPAAARHLCHGAPASRGFGRSALMRAARTGCGSVEAFAAHRQVRQLRGPAVPGEQPGTVSAAPEGGGRGE